MRGRLWGHVVVPLPKWLVTPRHVPRATAGVWFVELVAGVGGVPIDSVLEEVVAILVQSGWRLCVKSLEEYSRKRKVTSKRLQAQTNSAVAR